MPDEAPADETPGIHTPCHCCGAPADISCPLCAIRHCGNCQGDEGRKGATYIPIGFCPDCRALLFRSVETWGRLRELLASGPEQGTAGENGLEELDPSNWQERVENSLLLLSEASYLARRSPVPLRGMDAIDETMTDFRGRFIQLIKPGGAAYMDYASEGWEQMNDQFGRVALFLRVGDALLAGSADVRVDELQKEIEKALVGMFKIMLRERCVGFLATPTRRAIEESWARLADLYARLMGVMGRPAIAHQHARAGMSHLSAALDMRALVHPQSRNQAPAGMHVPVHEALRFELHSSRTYLLRAGVRSPVLGKFLDDYVIQTEEWLEARGREHSPSGWMWDAYQAYIQAGQRAFDSEVRWCLMPDPDNVEMLRDARGWAWTALCAGHICGHFKGEAATVGTLWVSYLADIDRRLRAGRWPAGNVQDANPALAGDAALLELNNLLHQAKGAGFGIWEASLIFHSIWNHLDMERKFPDRQLTDFASSLFISMDRFFPWAAMYMDRFLRLEQGSEAPPEEGPPSAGESDPWAGLAGIEGVRVQGEPACVAKGLWVIQGGPPEGSISALPEDAVVVGLASGPEGLERFGQAGGWDFLYWLCARHGAGRQVAPALVSVMDLGLPRPTMVLGEGSGDGRLAASAPAGVSVVRDPELLLFPGHLKQAVEAWSGGAPRRGAGPLRLILANPAILAIEGALRLEGENQK